MVDVADLVQEMRGLLWQVPHGHKDLYREVLLRPMVNIDWRRPESLRDMARALDAAGPRLSPEERERADACAEGFRQLAAAFDGGPPMPSEDDLIARYVGGEIGDRTVMLVLDWDPWRLFEACAARELPPIQMISDSSPAAMQGIAEHLRRLRDEDKDGKD